MLLTKYDRNWVFIYKIETNDIIEAKSAKYIKCIKRKWRKFMGIPEVCERMAGRSISGVMRLDEVLSVLLACFMNKLFSLIILSCLLLSMCASRYKKM